MTSQGFQFKSQELINEKQFLERVEEKQLLDQVAVRTEVTQKQFLGKPYTKTEEEQMWTLFYSLLKEIDFSPFRKELLYPDKMFCLSYCFREAAKKVFRLMAVPFRPFKKKASRRPLLCFSFLILKKI